MTALRYGRYVAAPRQVKGLYKRHPRLRSTVKPTRVTWTESAARRCTAAFDGALKNFRHRDDPPGKDEWGKDEWEWVKTLQGIWIRIARGDCDDAIPRVQGYLLDEGFPLNAMRLLVGRVAGKRNWHMVAALEIIRDGKPDSLILDHRHRWIWTHGEEGPTAPRGDLTIEFASSPGAPFGFWQKVLPLEGDDL